MKLNPNAHIRSGWLLPVAGLALFLAAAGCCSSRSSSGKTETSIPAIANLAGVKIGHSSQGDLEKAWGEGQIHIGSHPTSGCAWQIKGTSWFVDTDGWDYSNRGLVVDGLTVEMGPLTLATGPGDFTTNAPLTRLPKEKYAWMGGVQLGMSRSAVEQFLKSKSLAATATNQELVVQAPGYNAKTNIRGAWETWVVRLTFETNVLTKLNMYADERTIR